MKILHMVAVALVLVGALNWGLVGLFNVNLVSMILGSSAMAEKLVYILVGASAVYVGFTHKADCKACAKK